MTWSAIIQSVSDRIAAGAARDRELRVLYHEFVGLATSTDDALVFVVHCAACGWDSAVLDDAASLACLHCGAAATELIEIMRVS